MPTIVKKNQLIAVALVIVFLLPMILAQVFFTHPDWVSGKTNQGVLVKNQLMVTDFTKYPWPKETMKQWTLALFHPKTCDDSCQSTMTLLNNIRLATGKNQLRVARAIIQFAPQTTLKKLNMSKVNHLVVNKEKYQNEIQRHKELNFGIKSGTVYIISPEGQVVLAYPSLKKPKAVLKDLKKLLKVNA